MKKINITALKAAYICVFAAAAMLLPSCTQIDDTIPVETTSVTEAEISPYPIIIGSLTFNDAPTTVASLSPAVTEIIAELGFESKLICKSTYCTYPDSISGLKEIGSAANPDVDAIIEAAPQLLISQSPIAKKDITAIEGAGTRVLILPAPTSPEELMEMYVSIYEVFCGDDGNEASALQSLELLDEKLASSDDALGSFVYILSPDLAVATDNTFSGSFLSHFGKNLCADCNEDDGITLSAEKLLELSPEYLILPEGLETTALPEELSELEAIKEGNILVIDSETLALLERPTSRLSEAADSISAAAKKLMNGEKYTPPEENDDGEEADSDGEDAE